MFPFTPLFPINRFKISTEQFRPANGMTMTRERTHQYTKIYLTCLTPQIYPQVLTGSPA